MRHLRILVAAAFCATALFNVSAVAAPRKPTRETASPEEQAAKAQARAAYQRATKHYNLNEYTEALDGYKEAYRLYEDSSFLFNIAQCHRQLGTKLEAVRSYRSYLRAAPGAPNRAEVERLMAELEAELREESKSRPPTGTIGPGDTSATATNNPTTTTTDSDGKSATTATVETSAAGSQSTPVYKRWWLWTAIIVVVAAGAVACGIGISSAQTNYPSAATTAGTFRF